jgi:hypothetical protein
VAAAAAAGAAEPGAVGAAAGAGPADDGETVPPMNSRPAMAARPIDEPMMRGTRNVHSFALRARWTVKLGGPAHQVGNHEMNERRRSVVEVSRLAVLAVFVGLAVGVAGCGSDGNDAATSSIRASSTATTTTVSPACRHEVGPAISRQELQDRMWGFMDAHPDLVLSWDGNPGGTSDAIVLRAGASEADAATVDRLLDHSRPILIGNYRWPRCPGDVSEGICPSSPFGGNLDSGTRSSTVVVEKLTVVPDPVPSGGPVRVTVTLDNTGDHDVEILSGVGPGAVMTNREPLSPPITYDASRRGTLLAAHSRRDWEFIGLMAPCEIASGYGWPAGTRSVEATVVLREEGQVTSVTATGTVTVTP